MVWKRLGQFKKKVYEIVDMKTKRFWGEVKIFIDTIEEVGNYLLTFEHMHILIWYLFT